MRCDCCGLTSRIVVISIAVWTIVQCAVYITMSILSIQAKNCDLSMNRDALAYLMYIYYFRDGECAGPIQWQHLDVAVGNGVQPIMPAIVDSVARTAILTLFYLIASVVLLIASIMLIVGAFVSCMGKCGYSLFFRPWILISVFVIILDAISTVIYIVDITKNTMAEATLEFLQVENVNSVLPLMKDVNSVLLPIPPVLMMITTSRGFIIWALNIACVVYVMRTGRRIAVNYGGSKKRSSATVRRPDFGYEPSSTSNRYGDAMAMQQNVGEQRRGDDSGHQPQRSRYNDPSLYAYDNRQYTIDSMYNEQPPDAAAIVADRRSDDELNADRLSNARSLDSIENTSRTSSVFGSRSYTSSIDRNLDEYQQYARGTGASSTADKVSYQSFGSGTPATTADDRRMSTNGGGIRSQRPSLAKRRSNADSFVIVEENRRVGLQQMQQQPPDELRSQLPWSYFQSRDDVKGPKRTFTHLREDEDLPPVPVPDYTLHFPRKERPSTNLKMTDHDAELDERWAGPEYRY